MKIEISQFEARIIKDAINKLPWDLTKGIDIDLRNLIKKLKDVKDDNQQDTGRLGRGVNLSTDKSSKDDSRNSTPADNYIEGEVYGLA